jgi:arginyl-tRNA synthetase
MTIISTIQEAVKQAVKAVYDLDIDTKDVPVSTTRKEFEGDYTVTVFAFSKAAKKSPVQVGEDLGKYLVENNKDLVRYNVIQGFINLVVSDNYWINYLAQTVDNQVFGQLPSKGERVMVEYSSPNTNKPLHLGHIRNILLGWATSKILHAAGYDVVRTKVVNDRGIAICKSMLAWQLFGGGKTPNTEGVKGDHFVGHYYVLFEQKFQEEYKAWQKEVGLDDEILTGMNKKNLPLDEFYKEYKNEYFNKYSKLGAQAREMLLKWESGDAETVKLWETMNGWVYEGFNETYDKLGVSFDKKYYESNTYMLGKDIIEDGIKTGIFYQKPDTSVWIDLTDVKLDQKLVLRSDGTSVYITQDIGMARLRDKEWHCQKVVYVVADEQNYHFQVLFEIMKKLGEPYANGLYHLSYGMVELPSGRMKSREGTVVDADDLVAEVIAEAAKNAAERGETMGFSADEQAEINRKVGLAALKYHIVKVNPKKKMVFDPQESVDLQGQTGPYIQYSYVRINGVVKKAEKEGINLSQPMVYDTLETQEKDLITKIYEYPKAIEEAANTYDPSVIASYCYDLAKLYHKFWHDLSIFNVDTEGVKVFRLQLSKVVGRVLAHGMDLLGIEMPERM